MALQTFKKSVTFLVDEVEFNLMEQIMSRGLKRKNILSRGISECAKELNLHISGVSKVLNGITKTTKGYKFKYQ
jgi:hypothetical protein